jgi:hypothetical protein
MTQAQVLNTAVAQISVEVARTVGTNVAPDSTSGHYVVKASNVETIDAANGRFVAHPVAGELGLVTSHHGCVEIKTADPVQFVRQDEMNHFTGLLEKSRD